MGSVYDAMAGYIAMVLSPFAWGVAASHNSGYISEMITIPSDIYVILGALSGIFVIFPRFIMHKTITTIGNVESVQNVKNKSNYGIGKTIALNLISVTGGMQIFMLCSIFCNAFDVFTISYFVINGLIMFVSLISIFNKG